MTVSPLIKQIVTNSAHRHAPNPYADLTPVEASDLFTGRISTIVFQALVEAQSLSSREWEGTDGFAWSDTIAEGIRAEMSSAFGKMRIRVPAATRII